MNKLHQLQLLEYLRKLAFLTLLLIPSLSACQSDNNKNMDLVMSDGLNHVLHQDYLGKIVFTEGLPSFEEYDKANFLHAVTIDDNTNLAITAVLENSILNMMHPLAPSLSAEELSESGNYQFRFFVDDQAVFEENLNTGAGSFQQKSEYTILRAPLVSTRGEDFWSRYMWMRFFMRDGGEAALKNGTHTFRVEMRPYVDHNGIKVGDLIAQGEIQITLPEPRPATESEIAIKSIAPNSGWPLSDAKLDESLIRALNTGIAQKDFKEINGLVVIKEGELLLEEYFNGEDRSSLHDPRSVGKTFASTVAGIALQEGHLESVDQKLSEFYDLDSFDNNAPVKSDVTIKSLLNMSSGFLGNDQDYDSPGNEENMYPAENWVKFTLDLPMDESKSVGSHWEYFTAGVVVLGDILHQSVPGGLEAYADQKLFKPLGISEYKWQYTPQNVANTAGGLRLRALDFAKYGQLYKNGGKWGDQQILEESWVKETLTNYFPDTDQNDGYGYLFWRQVFEIDGKSYEAYVCNGNGGNKIYVFTDIPFVIVVTASAYNRPYAHPQVDRIMTKYLLPAVL